MKRYIVLIISILIHFSASAQEYKIKVKITPLKDTTIYLGYIMGESSFITDTARLNKNSEATFAKKKTLPGGIYLVIMPNRKDFFEIIMNDDQKFNLETDTSDFIGKMKISGCLENEIFYQSQNFLLKQHEIGKNLTSRKEKNQQNADSLKIIQDEINKIDSMLANGWRKIVKDYPKSFYAKMLIAANEDRGKFFDNVDFSDERFLRTNILYRTIRENIASTFNNTVEIIIAGTDKMITKASPNAKVLEYTFNYLLHFYNTFGKLGFNQVFVHLVDNYVAKGKTPWFDSASVSSIKERAKILRSSFIGEIAPDLDMQTPTGEFMKLHQLASKYTLVLFWSTGCGHCQSAVDKIKDFLKDGPYNMDIYAVYTKDNKKDWTDFIEKNQTEKWINVWDPTQKTNFGNLYYVVSTPIAFLLDNQKRIVASRAGDTGIADLLDQLATQKDKFKF
jgi:thiol-disulfide isomerase/thioredoxin